MIIVMGYDFRTGRSFDVIAGTFDIAYGFRDFIFWATWLRFDGIRVR